MIICLGRGANLHMAQLMPLPLTVSCFNKIQIGFTFLVPAHLGSPGKVPLNGCVVVAFQLQSCGSSSSRLTTPDTASLPWESYPADRPYTAEHSETAFSSMLDC